MNFSLLGKKEKKAVNYLELTPVSKYEHENGKDNNINVLVPRFRDFLLGKLIQPRLKNKYIRANLDQFGTATWLFIDGKANVEEIGKKLIEKFGTEIDPVYDRLTIFLTNLYKNGFITFKEIRKGKYNG